MDTALLAFIGSIATLIVSLVVAHYNRLTSLKVESVKTELQKEIEITKAELQRRQTKFTFYHQKQAEVLAYLYKNISKAGTAIASTNDHWHNLHKERRANLPNELLLKKLVHLIVTNFNEAKVTCSDTKQFLEENEIYIDDAYSRQVNNILNKFLTLIQNSVAISELHIDNPSNLNLLSTNDEILKEVSLLKHEIKQEVKRLIQG